MKNINILLTAIGCPGSTALINSIKNNYERKIKIIGTDISNEVSGIFFVDKFYKIAKSENEDKYIKDLLMICKSEKINLIFPQSSSDVLPLSKNKQIFIDNSIDIMLDNYEIINRCENKSNLYKSLKKFETILPKSYVVKNIDDLIYFSEKLDYPNKDICIKPSISKGSRGFRVISDRTDNYKIFLNEKTERTCFTLENCIDILSNYREFPEIIVSEYLDGIETSYDAYCSEGKVLFGFLKTRERFNAGLAMYFKIIKNEKIVNISKNIIKHLNFNYFINIQFKNEKLLEINPRISTLIYQKNFNLPYMAIKHFINELEDNDLTKIHFNLQEKCIRFYDQINYNTNEKKIINVY